MIPHSRPTLGREEKEAVLAVLDSGQIAQGEKVAEFEKNFSQFVGRRYAVALSSGTSALYLTLLALPVSPGDEIILPSYTCVALLHAIDGVKAKAVPVDIDPEDFNISAKEVKRKIRRKTKAIIVPHAFGRGAQMDALLDLKIPVLEDGTQALGASAGEKKVGSFGIASIFSFYATKMITTGEGGMVLTDSARLAQKIYDLRDYDKKKNFCFRTNSKMTDLEATMGLAQLKKLPSFVLQRREIAKRYQEAFRGQQVILPAEGGNRTSVYYRFVVRFLKKPKEWFKHLNANGIDAKEPIFKPIHQYLNLPNSQFVHTARAMKEACSLPIYPSLSETECVQVCQALRKEKSQQHVEV